MATPTVTPLEVPIEAAEWIQEVALGRPQRTSIENEITTTGLMSLTIRHRAVDLRHIHTMLPVKTRSVPKSATKAQLRQMIRHVLFSDFPICQKPKTELMKTLRRQVEEKRSLAANNVPTPPAAAGPAGLPAAPSTAKPLHPPAVQPHNMAPHPSYMHSTYHPHTPFPGMPSTGMMHNNPMWPQGHTAASFHPTQQFHTQFYGPFPTIPTFTANSGHAAAAATTTQAAPSLKRPRTDRNPIFVKPETSIGDPDATPRDPHEKLVCGQLQQNYGFSDVREMLTSYRRLKDSTVPSVEDVMIDIVSLREEADEAKKMDEARKQSEKSRKEEAKKRRMAIEQEQKLALESATIATFRSSHFPNSWILQGSASSRIEGAVTMKCTPLKRSLITLLELENKARKWYGPTLPRSYFRRILSSTLATCDSLVDTLDDRVKYLKNIMFQLSEQTQSGVPVAFRDAYDADNVLDDDDEIELQVTSPDKPKTTTPEPPSAKDKVIVIELLD